jgi:serine/threonine-protein kinase
MKEELPTTAKRPRIPEEERLTRGTVVGDYIIDEFLNAGGCGSVYRAEHRILGRQGAIKVLHREFANSSEMLQRFLREARAVSRIKHPNIVDIFDFGELDDGRPYYVMEYLAGTTLSDLLEQHGSFSSAEALQLIGPVCEALSAAHDAGVVHRDVKSSNVMVIGDWRESRVKLLDFGIAKILQTAMNTSALTTAGRRLGTPHFMAPEQFSLGPIDGRADIYALGVLLFHLLTNHYPFDSEAPVEIEQMHMLAIPQPPSELAPLSPAMDQVILRCLAKEPEGRYPDVRSFLEAFRNAATQIPHPDTRGTPTWRRAMAVYVEVLLELPTDIEPPDALLDDLAHILGVSHEVLAGANFKITLETGSAILATKILPEELESEKDLRCAGIETAARLRTSLDGRSGAQTHTRVRISAHVERALVSSGAEPEIIGGNIVSGFEWAGAASYGVCCSSALLEGLDQVRLARLGPILADATTTKQT